MNQSSVEVAETPVDAKLPVSIESITRRIPDVSALRSALDQATTVEEVVEIEARLSGFEKYMRESGLFNLEEVRPLNETRMWARWKLGQLLSKVARAQGARSDKNTSLSGLTKLLSTLGVTKPVALEAEHIGAMPDNELEKALARCHKEGDLCTFRALVHIARPYWYQASRKKKHKTIHAQAVESHRKLGPFPLIYADPPWKFETYSEKGLERTPDQHYPTLTDDEIIEFKVNKKPVTGLFSRDAALFLWCTSANLLRALRIMEEWGFEYKTHAVWDKVRSGTGLVFRNQHEVLLYGTRGKMPGPQHQPRSVFCVERGKHSEKPKEVRAAIEKMYPDFNEQTRVELFARKAALGWTVLGNEV